MQVISRLFGSGTTGQLEGVAAGTSTRRHPAVEETEAKPDPLVERLASLLGQLSEQDRQLLLNAAQRLSGE